MSRRTRHPGLAVAALLAVAAAHADRPLVATTTAAAEEDDDRVWSLHGSVERKRLGHTFEAVAEYAFDPVRSVEFGVERTQGRRGGDSETAVSAGGKWLFARIERDGWGVGVAAEVGAAREGDAGWRAGSWRLVVPFSATVGPATLHLNAGVERERGDARRWLRGAALEAPLARRLTLFGEAVRSGDARLASAGARWWLRRERVAIDLAAISRRDAGESRRGWVAGISVHEL